MIKNMLSIAGSDPSGGAGIQADLKTFAALGAYGMAVPTALTAQNTRSVTGVRNIEPDFLRAQITAIFDDIRVDAVKVGMLGTAESARLVAEMLAHYKPGIVVLDPVLVATSGDALGDERTLDILKAELAPMATCITPNLPEGEALLESEITDPQSAAQKLLQLGSASVLLKGGHDTGEKSIDILAYEGQTTSLEAPRIDTKNTHGTGCTLSSALAVYLAQGLEIEAAARAAKSYVTQAIKGAEHLDVGHGHGPLNHNIKPQQNV